MVCGGVVIKTMMMVITGCQHFYPNGSVEVFEFLYVVFKLTPPAGLIRATIRAEK